MSVYNILFLVFWTFFLASAALEIFYYSKKNVRMEFVFKPSMYAFLLISSLMILIQNFPDSNNIIICMTLFLSASLASGVILLYPKTRKKVLTACLLYVTGFICCTRLISPSFRLFSLPAWLTLLVLIIYAGLFASYYFFVIGKRNIVKTVFIAGYFLPLMNFHYGTILTVFGQPKLYSVLLFTGSSIFTAANALIVKGFFIKAQDKERLSRMVLYEAGLFLITAGYTLMVSF